MEKIELILRTANGYVPPKLYPISDRIHIKPAGKVPMPDVEKAICTCPATEAFEQVYVSTRKFIASHLTDNNILIFEGDGACFAIAQYYVKELKKRRCKMAVKTPLKFLTNVTYLLVTKYPKFALTPLQIDYLLQEMGIQG